MWHRQSNARSAVRPFGAGLERVVSAAARIVAGLFSFGLHLRLWRLLFQLAVLDLHVDVARN
jgi:hypothetical protein